nr:putative cysteine-rich receptor-like protein kinase 30 [Coffea arabica]
MALVFLKRRLRKSYVAMALETSDGVADIFTAESLQYSLTEIQIATNNFSVDNKIGEGGFGRVYKGVLGNGQEVAVKRLSRSSVQGAEEFKNEIVVVAKLQHRNLVRLLGFCLEGEEKILIYEFVPNKSLDYFLFGGFNLDILIVIFCCSM